MASSYTASDIEVLSGLDPVRRRPGMYTDTTRPNHLAHEVVDNSVDEALAGYCDRIDVTCSRTGPARSRTTAAACPSTSIPKEKISGVELILTRLHAGGKFNDKTYQHSGGLHGVGVSVVNALSKHLEVWVRRGGKEYNMSFADGKRAASSKWSTSAEVARPAPPAVLARSQVLRHRQDLAVAKPEAGAARQGGALPEPARSRSPTKSPASATSGIYTGGLHEYLRRAARQGRMAARRRPSTASATSRAARSNGLSPGCSRRAARQPRATST